MEQNFGKDYDTIQKIIELRLKKEKIHGRLPKTMKLWFNMEKNYGTKVTNSKLYFTSSKQLAETIKRLRSKPLLTRRLGFSVLIQNNIRSTRSGIVSLFLTPNPTEWLALLSHFILVMYYLSVYYTRVFFYTYLRKVFLVHMKCVGGRYKETGIRHRWFHL